MKKILFLAFAFMAMESISFAQSYDFSAVAPSGQTLYYEINNNNNTVSVKYPTWGWEGYTKPVGDLIIPDSVTHNGITYTVTKIVYAFYQCTGLTTITIPNSVTYIDESSFKNCSGLTSV